MRKVINRFAVVSAVMAGVAGGVSGANGTVVYLQSNLTDVGYSPRFVALVDADKHRPPLVMYQWGSNLKSGPSQTSFDVPTSSAFDSYAVFGLDSAGGVFVSFADASGVTGKSFDSVFPGISESQLASDLLQSSDSQLVTSFGNLLAQTPADITAVGGNIVGSTTHFSNGANYGTIAASFTPVPEPTGGLAILTAAGLGLQRRRRIPTT